MEPNENDVQPVRKRGFWLSAFLIFMMIVNPITASIYFTNPEPIISLYPKLNVGLLYFMGTLSLLNVVLAALVWAWKKLGVYCFYVVVAIAFAVNLYVGIGVAGSISGVIGGVAMYLLTRKRWEYFS